MELADNRNQGPTVGQEVVQVVGAVGAQLDGFLECLSHRLTSVGIDQQEDPTNMGQGVKFPLPQRAIVGFGPGTQSASKRASKAASLPRLRSAKSRLT